MKLQIGSLRILIGRDDPVKSFVYTKIDKFVVYLISQGFAPGLAERVGTLAKDWIAGL